MQESVISSRWIYSLEDSILPIRPTALETHPLEWDDGRYLTNLPCPWLVGYLEKMVTIRQMMWSRASCSMNYYRWYFLYTHIRNTERRRQMQFKRHVSPYCEFTNKDIAFTCRIIVNIFVYAYEHIHSCREGMQITKYWFF